MAERRMFAKTIIDSDAFLDMSLSTQALYFHLSMRADDDGFINNPKKIGRMIGANDDEFKILFAKKFILGFESGVIVIKHWKIHNYIQKDRYKKTNYHEEMALLSTEENNGYSMDTACIQDVSTGKVRLGKVRIEKDKKMYESENDFTLKAVTKYSSVNEEYKIALEEYMINYIDMQNQKLEDAGAKHRVLDFNSFILGIEAKDWKYANFVKAYRTWNIKHIERVISVR